MHTRFLCSVFFKIFELIFELNRLTYCFILKIDVAYHYKSVTTNIPSFLTETVTQYLTTSETVPVKYFVASTMTINSTVVTQHFITNTFTKVSFANFTNAKFLGLLNESRPGFFNNIPVFVTANWDF